ncbi:MAG: hypothetical protein OXF79_14790 [Chloroflexi bacterium]|nr:hypothetical protein [Chloroflexota bacterium]
MSRALYIGCIVATCFVCMFLWYFTVAFTLPASFDGHPSPFPFALLCPLAFGTIATTTFTAFRLSDMGQPPLAAMLVLVPFVNIAVVIWCALSPGQPHNQYHQTSITRNPSNQNPPRRIRK